MNSFIKLIGIILNFSLLFALISSELFTSLVHLEKIIGTEKQVIDLLEQYLLFKEEKITRLKKIKLQFDELHSISSVNVQQFLNNPINAFILIKRLSSDLKKIFESNYSDESDFNVLKTKANFPSLEDFKGTAEAIFRLQDVYKLETKLLAEGCVLINKSMKPDNNNCDDENRLKMSSDDCFELGRHAYISRNYNYMELWMNEAFKRLKKEKHDIVHELKILDYLSYASYMRGNASQASELTKNRLLLSPEDRIAQEDFEFYEKNLDQFKMVEKKNEEFSKLEDSIIPETEEEIYKSLCRGENRLSDKIKSKLFCFHLNTNKIPYLRYTRIKVEEVFKRPQVVVFHEIISDSEIEDIKTLAEPYLDRSKVKNGRTGESITSDYRISKVAWLEADDNPVIDRIARRIGYITGLEIMTAERIQVVNYGIAGHYTPHWDFFSGVRNRPDSTCGYIGNRIATWLSYMSEVEAGGATVFPLLGITIWPKKSSAAFWYNLRKSGEGEMLTKHAACPVLIGSKWASNAWFSTSGQEFRKPCSLIREDLNALQNVY